MIKEKLCKYGITEQDSDGKYIIADKYRGSTNSGNDEERLRIGTVDSFQGMEFDIVMLSAVRSKTDGQIQRIVSSRTPELAARSIFGHLMSENRLCVSMSRQIKKLIVVGDLNLFNQSLSMEKVPGLYNFYKLCSEKGVILDE